MNIVKAKKPRIGNQENLRYKVYDYHPTPNKIKRAVLVHILSEGECSKCWEEDGNHYTDGNKVFKRITV